MANVKRAGSRFIADLGELRLPEAVEKKVDGEIRRLILRSLAEIDFEGDLHVGFPFPPGRTLGIILEPIDRMPSPFPRPRPQPGEPLSVVDHTIIATAVMEHPFHILRQLDTARSARPSQTEVLVAATKVASFDTYTKGRLEEVLALLPKLEQCQKEIPHPTGHALNEITQQIDKAQGITNLIETLGKMKESGKYKQDEALTTGLEIALQLLEDGKDTVYFPGSGYYDLFRERERPGVIFKSAGEHASDIGKEDAKGAVEGAVGGAIVGGTTAGPGALPGALIGGAAVGGAKSAAEIVGKVWDWIFG